MRNKIRTSSCVVTVAIVVYITSCLIAVFTNRALYADGSDIFVELINSKFNSWPIANDWQMTRLFANFWNQIFVSIALKLGITNLTILRFLFGIPLFFNNILGMFWCYRLLKKMGKTHCIIYPMIGFCFFNILSEIFIVNQSFLAYWIYLISYLYILGDLKLRWYDNVIFILCLATGFLAHEGGMIFSTIMLMVIIQSIFNRKSKGYDCKKIIIALICVCQIGFILLYRHLYSAPGKATEYLNNIWFLLDFKSVLHSNLLISYAGIVLILLTLKKKVNLMFLFFLLLFGLIWESYVLGFRSLNNPVREYNYRVLITANEIVVFILLYIDFRYDLISKLKVNVDTVMLLIGSVWILQSIWQINNSYNWNNYINEFKAGRVTYAHEVLIQNDQIFYSKKDAKYYWPWCAPALSIALQNDYTLRSMVEPDKTEKEWQIYMDNDTLVIPYVRLDKRVFDYTALENALLKRTISTE